MAYPLCTRCGGPDAPGHPCLRDRIDVDQGRQLLAMAQDGDQIPAARWLLHHGASLLYAAERLDALEAENRKHESKVAIEVQLKQAEAWDEGVLATEEGSQLGLAAFGPNPYRKDGE